jgi:glycosyltransferase involved in cell wall biosynthesis
MRIAIFSDSYTPILNGVSVSIEGLVEELRARKHSVHVFTSAAWRYRDHDPNVYRFFALKTPFAKDYPLAIPPFYPMLRSFRKNTFDIIHTHTPFTLGFVGLRWAESHYLPLVSTYHTLYEKYMHYIPILPKRYLRYKLAKHTNYYYNRCAHVIAPSEAAMKSLQRHLVTAPISVIPSGNPSPVSIPKADARKRIGARPDERILLYVGRIAKEKNMSTLLEMARNVMRERDDIRFWLVGDGPYRSECRKLARELGIGDRVKFVGAIPREMVDVYYCAANVFVFASMTETQGLVIGEAMTHGVPAVAVHGGGAADFIVEDHNGYIVSNNPTQFGEVVLRMLSNPALLGRLSESARKSVKRWTMSDMCDSILGVYEQAIGSYGVKEVSHADAYTAAH